MASAAPGLSYEIGAVFVVAFVVLGALYALNRYLKRRGPELATREGRGVLDDRSYNQIRIGEAAADRLSRSGTDVTAAKMLLARAETARASGSYEMAIQLAKEAQNLLAVARSGAQPLVAASSSRSASMVAVDPASGHSAFTPPTFAPAPRSAPPAASSSDLLMEAGPSSAGAAVTSSSRAPKNKMEAHFQLSLATEELDLLPSTTPRTKNMREADRLRAEGQAAYERQDYTEALRLALRSRRALGSRVEGLPVATVPSLSPAAAQSADPSHSTLAASTTVEAVASGPKCPQCGRPAASNDRFCRSCGGPIPPSLCGNCAAPLLAGDRFCGVCGAVQA